MRFLVAFAATAMPVIAWLSQRGLFGPDNGTISDRYPTLLVAAGYAFSVWGVIFALDVALALWQLRKSTRGALSARTRGALTIGFASTALWMPVFSREAFWVALALIWVALAAMVAALFFNSQDRVRKNEALRIGFIDWAIGLHAGWLSLAAFLNTAQVVVAYELLPVDGMLPWSAVLWLLAGLLLLAVNASVHLNLAYVAAALWGLVGVVVEQSASGQEGAGASALLAGALGIVLAVQSVSLFLRNRPPRAATPRTP